jgi:hypothetical protein
VTADVVPLVGKQRASVELAAGPAASADQGRQAAHLRFVVVSGARMAESALAGVEAVEGAWA